MMMQRNLKGVPRVGGMARGIACGLVCLVVVAVASGCSGTLTKASSDAASPLVGSVARSLAEVDRRAQKLELVAPKPERWVLPNGLTVFFAQDDELPLVSVSLFTRGGAFQESLDEYGVVAAMGDQLRQGGTYSLTPEALDEQLERLSARLATSVGQEFGRFQFSALNSDFEQVMRLFGDVVLRPRFDPARLELWKGQLRETIRRRVDDPNTVASLSVNELLYGGTPYGIVLGSNDLGRFTRPALVRSHERFVQPNGAILTVSGRIDRAIVERMVKEVFSSWRPARESMPPPPPITSTVTPGIYFIELPLQQSTIAVAQRGVPRFTSDQFAIEAFNNFFGSGGFGSRLMKKVRTEGGMAYSVFGSILAGAVQGKNIMFLQTKTETTGEALAKTLGELRIMQTELVAQGELEETKSALIDSFVFNFDSPARAMSRVASQELLNFPEGYDERYIAEIGAVTPEDLRAVAQNRWNPLQFVVVLVGNGASYDRLQELLKKSPDLLPGLPLHRVKFHEKLERGDRYHEH